MSLKDPGKMSEQELRKEVWSDRQLLDAFESRTSELSSDLKTMMRVNDGQTEIIADLRKEIKRLKEIDQALRDFNFELYKSAREQLEKEGFDAVVASRPMIGRHK